MNSFHNTNNLKGDELEQAETKAKTQENIVSEIFKNAGKGLTASEVFKSYLFRGTPLTSIRRAITNLCTQRVLFKTSATRLGLYGKPEHIYETLKSHLPCQECEVCPKSSS